MSRNEEPDLLACRDVAGHSYGSCSVRGVPGNERQPEKWSVVAMTVTIFYHKIQDVGYPRNRKIRGWLDHDPRFRVIRAEKSTGVSRRQEFFQDVRRLWAGANEADILVVSEFSLRQAPIAGLIAKLRGCRVVVDGFVGRYETVVEDRQIVPARSFRAALARLEDWASVRSADLYLIDNEYRAHLLREKYGHRLDVLSIPVGAPDWAKPAQPQGPRKAGAPLEVLYYGNYVPLHGLDIVVDALALAAQSVPVHATFIGSGQTRSDTEAAIREVGAPGLSYVFMDPVLEASLARYIQSADVVLGVFGPSPKARSVVANKVWQGLACGKPVATQQTDALGELRRIAPTLLMESEPGSAESLGDIFLQVFHSPPEPDHDLLSQLCSYADRGLQELSEELLNLVDAGEQ